MAITRTIYACFKNHHIDSKERFILHLFMVPSIPTRWFLLNAVTYIICLLFINRQIQNSLFFQHLLTCYHLFLCKRLVQFTTAKVSHSIGIWLVMIWWERFKLCILQIYSRILHSMIRRILHRGKWYGIGEFCSSHAKHSKPSYAIENIQFSSISQRVLKLHTYVININPIHSDAP